jgi:hypothetical protein
MTNSKTTLVFVLLSLARLASLGCDAFQFMKDWKMPTYDPNEEAVKVRFGDKSEFFGTQIVLSEKILDEI